MKGERLGSRREAYSTEPSRAPEVYPFSRATVSVEDPEGTPQWGQQAARECDVDAREAEDADENRGSGDRWRAAMLRGDFEAAWRESDCLRAGGSDDPHRFWNGESLVDRRVIVRCLHGFGDAVQMLRYAPLLKAAASRVIWEVAPRFVEVASCFKGVDEVVTWGEMAPAVTPAWDVQLEVMELPYIFRTQVSSLPIAERYCTVPANEQEKATVCLRDAGPNVGIVWAAGEWNRERSVPFHVLRSLLETPGVTFWNLQGGAARSEASGFPDATEACGDGLLALAAMVAKLDLMVTVDTLAAHLAAAIGRPVWVMLQKEADWRWMAEGRLTPWYPTMRLFRQERSGDWAGVVSQVALALRREFT